jgi:UDP-glucose 4-epimerase
MSAGYHVVILDNLSNSKAEVTDGIARIAGTAPELVKGDIRDQAVLDQLFSRYQFDAVMHFAGLKSVGESVSSPLRYYDNNVHGSLKLFEAMHKHGVRTLVFSSSATVYGNPASLPIREDFPLQATNPYGRTKLMIEEILRDLNVAEPHWNIAILRYFNPVGAHASGLIGELPNGIPNNLMPYITQVAAGLREYLSVFGNDYPTPDGTGVRDYIHVVDLAQGHLKALEKLERDGGLHTYNLGAGHGYSVLEILRAFNTVTGRDVPFRFAPRREGDVAMCFASCEKASKELQWQATRGMEAMCADAWRWQEQSPLPAESHTEN